MHAATTRPARSISPHPPHVAAALRALCDSLREEWENSTEAARDWKLGDIIDWLELGGEARYSPDSITAALAFFRRLQSVRAAAGSRVNVPRAWFGFSAMYVDAEATQADVVEALAGFLDRASIASEYDVESIAQKLLVVVAHGGAGYVRLDMPFVEYVCEQYALEGEL